MEQKTEKKKSKTNNQYQHPVQPQAHHDLKESMLNLRKVMIQLLN